MSNAAVLINAELVCTNILRGITWSLDVLAVESSYANWVLGLLSQIQRLLTKMDNHENKKPNAGVAFTREELEDLRVRTLLDFQLYKDSKEIKTDEIRTLKALLTTIEDLVSKCA